MGARTPLRAARRPRDGASAVGSGVWFGPRWRPEVRITGSGRLRPRSALAGLVDGLDPRIGRGCLAFGCGGRLLVGEGLALGGDGLGAGLALLLLDAALGVRSGVVGLRLGLVGPLLC